MVAARDGVAEGGPATDDAFEWTESRYDTSVALERAKQLRDGGFALTCVWSASRITSSPHIDHCFPWARWRNNDLWNLLPARGNINLSKERSATFFRRYGRRAWTSAGLVGTRLGRLASGNAVFHGGAVFAAGDY